MILGRFEPLAAWVLPVLIGAILSGCSGRKQVPFGLKDAGAPDVETVDDSADETIELPLGQSFGPDQVEVPVAESTLVLQSG